MRILLWPFSLLWGGIIRLRNLLYDKGWLRSFAFDFPVICIGNLSTGGTGKTPHTAYCIELLQMHYRVATLSRGYKRKLIGYGLATELSLVEDIGDEPKLFKQLYPDTEVAVSINRVQGVYFILQDEPGVQVIVMDDGFQHRRITAGLNILLTRHDRLYTADRMIPAGDLREPASSAHRAQAIVVSKCPADMGIAEKETILEKLYATAGRQVFFTCYRYLPLRPLFADQEIQDTAAYSAALWLAGIAGKKIAPAPLHKLFTHVQVLGYPDHFYYRERDLEYIRKKLLALPNACVVTTEKDAMRLMEQKERITAMGLPVFVLPVQVEFLFGDRARFDRMVLGYVEECRAAMGTVQP